MTPVQPSPAESGGREVRGDLNPIPGQLTLPGMPPFPGARNGQPTLPGLDDLTDPAGAGDAELAAVAAELAALDADGARMGAAIRGALDMLLDGQHTGRYRWEQLHKTEKTYAGTLIEIAWPGPSGWPTAPRSTTRSRARTWTASSPTSWAAG